MMRADRKVRGPTERRVGPTERRGVPTER